jgi:hypothetical protein
MLFTVEYGEQALRKELQAMNVQRSHSWLKALALVGVALMAAAIMTPGARAATQTFSTPPGAMSAGGPVSATATFTITGGTLSITLVDNLVNPGNIGQLLSDLKYTVDSGSPGTALSTSSGQEITVNTTANNGFTLGSTVPAGWIYSSSGTTGTLDDLAGGGAGPKHLIIGPPGPGPAYSNGNASFVGNGPHNPLLNQSASFTITGVTGTTITNVIFSFGTTTGDNVTGVVPEPSTLAVACLGALGFGGYGLRRRKRK